MNVEEIFKKFEEKKLDWDKIVYSREQAAAGSPKTLIDAFQNFQIEMAGQAHSVCLFANIEEDGTATYYLTPESIKIFCKAPYHFTASACERPDQSTVKLVVGSATSSDERFWDK